MTIGLLRHFKVLCPYGTWIDSAGFQKWNHRYDFAAVICKPLDLRGIRWTRCWSSDMPRALTTAKACGIPFEVDVRLREVPMNPDRQTASKKLTLWWMVLARLAWRKNHPSQNEGNQMTTERVHHFLEEMFQEVDDHDNVLLVCHGFLMRELRKELIKRGFVGESFVHAENGQVYLFHSR